MQREGTPAANDKFIGSLCRTAADAPRAEAERSRDTLLAGGVNALQASMGGKSAERLLRRGARPDENNPNNYPS